VRIANIDDLEASSASRKIDERPRRLECPDSDRAQVQRAYDRRVALIRETQDFERDRRRVARDYLGEVGERSCYVGNDDRTANLADDGWHGRSADIENPQSQGPARYHREPPVDADREVVVPIEDVRQENRALRLARVENIQPTCLGC